jgi:hypothetical protein
MRQYDGVTLIQVVENPLPKIKRALVIAGSDKRGTIFGFYDVSKQIGVSPWYWWADVPVNTNNNLHVKPAMWGQSFYSDDPLSPELADEYGVDDETPQVINIHPDVSTKAWEKSVADNIIQSSSRHLITKPGMHVVKFWRVDPAVVLQKIVVETTGVKPSYLGPPESYYQLKK